MEEEKRLDGASALVELLADGLTVEECVKELTCEPWLIPVEEVNAWLKDAELLQRAIDRSNDLIGQAWGTMWKSIKRSAMLGSIQHSKLLIEYLSNDRRLGDKTLKVIFDDAVAGVAPGGEADGDEH